MTGLNRLCDVCPSETERTVWAELEGGQRWHRTDLSASYCLSRFFFFQHIQRHVFESLRAKCGGERFENRKALLHASPEDTTSSGFALCMFPLCGRPVVTYDYKCSRWYYLCSLCRSHVLFVDVLLWLSPMFWLQLFLFVSNVQLIKENIFPGCGTVRPVVTPNGHTYQNSDLEKSPTFGSVVSEHIWNKRKHLMNHQNNRKSELDVLDVEKETLFFFSEQMSHKSLSIKGHFYV